MKTRKNEDLIKSAKHFMYELTEFRRSASILNSGKLNGKQAEINVYLDDFVIHARNLYSFFYDENPQDDDVVADYYLKDKENFLKNRTPIDNLRIINTKAGKQVAHLTFSRIKYDTSGKGWTVGIYSVLLEKTITAFFTSLDEETKGWFY